MDNNHDVKKLKVGEKVYILIGNDNEFNYVKATVTKTSQTWGNVTLPYHLMDVDGKPHSIYYPESTSNEQILTLHEFIDKLRSFRGYAIEEINRLKNKSRRAEYLVEELMDECGKNGIEHDWGAWEKTTVVDDPSVITVHVSDHGTYYNVGTEKTKWRRICKCCGRYEYVSKKPEGFIVQGNSLGEDRGKTR